MSIFTINISSFTYPTGRRALEDISFEVQRGEFVTVCGLSGCGKSTLLRLLKQGLAPRGRFAGEILFDGVPLTDIPRETAARQTGFVLQDPDSQLVTDRVWHELAFSLESAGIPTSEIRRRVSEMAGYFGLEELFKRECASLSGGQKQMVNLAAAAALHPEVLLLDEPSSQLDPIAAQGFIDALARLNRDFGITVIIAEHRLEELLHLSDRLLVLEEGRLIADLPPREVCSVLAADSPIMQAMPLSVRLYSEGAVKGREAPLTLREASRDERCLWAAREHRATPPKNSRGEPLITARQLWVSFGKRLPDVLKSADITVYGGQIYAVLGGNGSGKTTLLKCLNGKLKPLGGSVRRGRGVTTAYLPQNPCELFTQDSVRGELELSSADYEEMSRRFSLTELYDSHPYDLSGGEQQRLALAKLMLRAPDVLLLDEPTKGMDAASRAELCGLLRKLAEGGTAVVLVTHDVQLAEDCADVCGLLFNGEITDEAPPEEFFGGNYFYTTPLRRLLNIAEK